MTRKIIAIKRRQVHHRDGAPRPEVHEVTADQTKGLLKTLLFDRGDISHCIGKHENRLYIMEPMNVVSKDYTCNEIEYHPLAHMLD
jgi:hypothetical protein